MPQFEITVELRDKVLRMALPIFGGNYADAEDATQQVLFKAWRSKTWEGRGTITTYLRAALRNEFLQLIRSRKGIETCEVQETHAVTPCIVIAYEARERLANADQHIKGIERPIISLTVRGFECGEIGKILRMPATTVRVKLMRVRAKLRKAA